MVFKKFLLITGQCVICLFLLVSCNGSNAVADPQTTPPAIAQKSSPTPDAVATPTTTPSPQPTMSYPVFINTPWPKPSQIIDQTNIDQLKPLVSLGYGLIYDAAVSADHSKFVVATANGFYLYDSSSLELKGEVGTSSPVMVIAFSPDGNTIAAGETNNNVQLWDVSTNKLVQTLEFDSFESESSWRYGLKELLFSPDGKYLEVTNAIAGETNITIWDISTGQNILTFNNTDSSMIKVSADGTEYAVATADSLNIFQFENNSAPTDLGIKNATLIKYSPDGKVMAVVTGNIVNIVNLTDGSIIEKVPGKDVEFSPDNTTFSTTLGNGTISVFSISSDQSMVTSKFYLFGYDAMVFSPDGKFFAVSMENYCTTCTQYNGLDRNERLSIYSLEDGSLFTTLSVPPTGYQFPNFKIKKFLFINDRVITLSEDTIYGSILRVWDIASNTLVKEIAPIHPTLPIAFSPDSMSLVTYSALGGDKLFIEEPQPPYDYNHVNEYEFSLWNITEGSVIQNYDGGKVIENNISGRGMVLPERLSSVFFSPDGKKFSYNGYFNHYKNNLDYPTARTWNIADAQATYETGVIAYAPDGTMARSNGNVIEILKDSVIMQTLTQDLGFVSNLFFSKDGSLLAASYDSRKVVVWDVKTGTLLKTFPAYCGSVEVRFSADNTKVIENCQLITIIDFSSGNLVKQVETESYWVMFAVSPVADLLVTIPETSYKNQIKIYSTSGELLRIINTPYWDNPNLSFSPDGTMLAIAFPGSVQIWGIDPSNQ